MGIKPLKLFLFCCIFAFIISSTILGEGEVYQESRDLKLEISKDDSFNYLHIIVESKTKNNPIVLVGDDLKCKNRFAVGLQPYSPINLFIQRKDIQMTLESGKSLYVCVTCQNQNDCLYTMKYQSEDIYELALGEQISFYSKYLSKMFFKFTDKPESSSSLKRNLVTIKNAANIWVKGENIKTASLKKEGGYGNINQNSFDFGYIFIIEDTDESAYILEVEFEQEQEQEGYITIGSNILIQNDNPKLINTYDSSKELQLNDLQMMGILNLDINYICFPIKNIEEPFFAQVNGRIFTKKAKVYLSLNNEEFQSAEINNGLIFQHVFTNNVDEVKFCVSYPESDEKQHEIIFEFQLTDGGNQKYTQFIYPPQLPGVIYSHFLFKGQIAVFRGMKPKKNSKEINFNMKTIRGFPDMLFDWSKNFPFSVYDNNTISNITNPRHANRMTIHSIYKTSLQK